MTGKPFAKPAQLYHVNGPKSTGFPADQERDAAAGGRGEKKGRGGNPRPEV